MTDKQTVTVLAALRCWQDVLQEGRHFFKDEKWVPMDEADHFLEHEPLTLEEIDQLYEDLDDPGQSENISVEEFQLIINTLRDYNGNAPAGRYNTAITVLADKLDEYFNGVKK